MAEPILRSLRDISLRLARLPPLAKTAIFGSLAATGAISGAMWKMSDEFEEVIFPFPPIFISPSFLVQFDEGTLCIDEMYVILGEASYCPIYVRGEDCQLAEFAGEVGEAEGGVEGEG
jgi:hypothetical protein